ncbi:PKD domain-containing protein, partial [Candidatus Bipolaricaulota bacterium]|nr:PKD domain-containing protein [Candidatus Bipolaricaulota bacterium]
GAPRPSDAPTADFDPDPRTVVAPLQIRFDPGDSDASAGLDLVQFIWTFGDGDSDINATGEDVFHSYVTELDEEEFEVTLRVVDENNSTDTDVQTVTVYNRQPVAGFELYYEEVDAIATAEGDADDGHWLAEDVDYATSEAPYVICIRSEQITDADWERDAANPTPASVGGPPDTPNWEDNNYSYDPEGQTWDDVLGNLPEYFPGTGVNTNPCWGIKTIEVNWGDGTWDPYAYDSAGDNVLGHEYDSPGSYTVTVTVIDHLGGEDSFARDISF